MKVSVSPVSVFLREEVCNVSDHLAAVSLFSSEEWMSHLSHFEGWIDTSSTAEGILRALVGSLRLRPLNEPGDIDSPLLRNQIDDQFLRTMVAAREQMSDKGISTVQTKKQITKNSSKGNQSDKQRHGLPLHPQSVSPVCC